MDILGINLTMYDLKPERIKNGLYAYSIYFAHLYGHLKATILRKDDRLK